MKKKEIILLAIVLVLVIASGILLFKSFNEDSFQISSPTVSETDILIRSDSQGIDKRMQAAFDKLNAGGQLDSIINNPQYQELTAEFIRPIEPGVGGRANPFTPIPREPIEPEL